MKCLTSTHIKNCGRVDDLAEGLEFTRLQIQKKIDTAYCAERFGYMQSLDLCDEDYQYEMKEKFGRNYYTLTDIVEHSFSYMQISSEKLNCTDEIVDKFDVCNLYDVDSFIITKCQDNDLTLNITTDYAADGSSIKAFDLTIKDIQELNNIAVIMVIDMILSMLDESYQFNGAIGYEFTSHKPKYKEL